MPTSANQAADEWFRHAFDDLYPSLYEHRGIAEAQDLLASLRRFLPLTDGPVLDVGCGPGRYLRALADSGARPIGADLSLPLLIRARMRVAEVPLVRADMRALPFRPGSIALILLMFTTFGYFLSEEEDLTVLRGVASLLRPQGKFVLDYVNSSYLREHLVPISERRLESLTVDEKRWIDGEGSFLHKESRVTNTRDGSVRVYRERLRLYDPSQIESMLLAAGLGIERRLGDYGGGPFERTASARLLIIAGPERRSG